MKHSDPLLRVQPWRVMLVFNPIESMLSRLERDGTVDAIGRQIVFTEESSGDRYDLPEAIRGVVDFHRLAEEKFGFAANTDALAKFANKLDSGSPIFEQDIEAVRANIRACWSQALRMRVSQAVEILNIIQTRNAMTKMRRAA